MLRVRWYSTEKSLVALIPTSQSALARDVYKRQEYYSNYQRYQLMQVDKTRVILACRIIINDLLGKLYRYDYRFGYNLLLDEENSIEKKLHTPVREEWEVEEYEAGDC